MQGEDASRASDIYALAAVLYETLTGSPPFSRPTDAATLYAHVAEPPPRPSEARPELGAQIVEVIAHGLAKLPSERPPTALALMDEAERALRSHPRRARSAVTPVAVPPPTAPARKDATTDVLAEPDLAAHAAAETADEPTQVEPSPPQSKTPARARTAPTPRMPVAQELAPTVADTQPAPVAQPAQDAKDPSPVDSQPADASKRAMPAEPSRPSPTTGGSAPAQSPRARLTRRGRLALGVVAAAVAACGFLVGSSGGEEQTPEQSLRPVSTPTLSLSVPATWTRRTPAPSIEGLKLNHPVGYGPAARQPAVLLAGLAPEGAGPTLLPRAFRERLAAAPSRDDRVALSATLQAQRYAGLLPRGAESRLTLLVAPTTAGVLTIACREGGAGEGFLAACQRAAKSTHLRGATALGLGPDRSYSSRLTSTLERLEGRRSTAMARLRGAKTPDGQARRARDVVAAYSSAARSLAFSPANALVREHHATIRTALRKQAGRYSDLSRAAKLGRPVTYKRAVAAIGKGQAVIREAIAAFTELGYER